MIFLWIALGVLALLIIWGVVQQNRIVRFGNDADEKLAQIDVQLQNRSEMIPNLVATVKGYAAHEKEALIGTVEARNANVDRNGADLAALEAAANDVEDATKAAQAAKTLQERVQQNNLIPMDRLMLLTENYPNLKASANFAQLQEQITSVQNKVTASRQLYNNSAKAFNNQIQMFPGSLIAGMLHAEKRAYLEVPQAATVNPTVSF